MLLSGGWCLAQTSVKGAGSQSKWFAAGLAAALLLVWRPAAGAALERWQTQRFVILAAHTDARRAQAAALVADRIAAEAEQSLGLRLPGMIELRIAGTRARFDALQPAGAQAPLWAAGMAFPRLGLIVVLHTGHDAFAQTLRHEISHLLLGRLFGARHKVPVWLHEGLAMAEARQWSMSRLATMTGAVLTDQLLPMDQLAQAFPRDVRDAEVAYCQSFYFISFLKGEFGEQAFQRFLERYGATGDFSRAVIDVYGMSWSRLTARWQRYLRLRFSWIPLCTSTGTVWCVASLIFVWGYARKRRAARRIRDQWTREETAAGAISGAPDE